MLDNESVQLSESQITTTDGSGICLTGPTLCGKLEQDDYENKPHVVDSAETTSKGGIVANQNGGDQRKKKHRRGKRRKRRWKPYSKLTWKEQEELEKQETRRVNRTRARMIASGQPVAPYNTTQFLMEQHKAEYGELDISEHQDSKSHHRVRDNSLSLDSDEDFYSSPEDEEEFLQQQFSSEYNTIHAERLNTMTKTELIQEYLQLEDKLERLESQLKKCDEHRRADSDSDDDMEMRPGEIKMDPETAEKVRIFQEEIIKLSEENQRLREENDSLNASLSGIPLNETEDSDSDSCTSLSSSSCSSCDSDGDSDSIKSQQVTVPDIDSTVGECESLTAEVKSDISIPQLSVTTGKSLSSNASPNGEPRIREHRTFTVIKRTYAQLW